MFTSGVVVHAHVLKSFDKKKLRELQFSENLVRAPFVARVERKRSLGEKTSGLRNGKENGYTNTGRAQLRQRKKERGRPAHERK